MSEQSSEPVFILGLTMAGAVSAGAYNAGVFDFLIQALEEWERARARDLERPEDERIVPNHRILIPIVTGASAGGATAALGVFGVSEETNLEGSATASDHTHVVPALYKTWVESISFTGDDRTSTLLGNEDLQPGQKVTSLLDGTVLRNTAESVIRETKLNSPPRPYFSKDLHVFLTITNLRGIPYGIQFTGEGASQLHTMSLHADRVHYNFAGAGTGDFESDWLNEYEDHGTPITTAQIQNAVDSTQADVETRNAKRFVTAALATGAFPAGLPAQHLVTHSSEYNGRAWPYKSRAELGDILPIWPRNHAGDETYEVSFAGVDGGVINNEPFDIARWAIMDKKLDRNEPSAEKADRAVLLVDPFPQPASFDPNLTPEDTLASVTLRSALLSLFPALKNQARVKPIDLTRSMNDAKVFSRFIISPTRYVEKDGEEEPAVDALATGVLGAFGGFLSRKFPEHDYQLGRRNCQHFLRKHFCVAKDNPIVIDWPEGADERHEKDENFRALVPLFGSAQKVVSAPVWPQINNDEVEAFVAGVETRGNNLISVITKTEFSSWFWSFAAGRAWWWYRSAILRRIRRILLADLIRRDQHALYAGLAEDVERHILACFLDLPEDKCTPRLIAEELSQGNATTRGFESPSSASVAIILENSLADFVEPKNQRDEIYVLREPFRPLGEETILSRLGGVFTRR